MTTPNEATSEATEAGLGPTAQWPKAAASPEANNVEILAQDSKAARIMARAEAKRIEAAAQTEAKNAEAARQLNNEAASLQRAGLKAARRQAKADNRAAQLAEGRSRAARKAKRWVASIRGEAAASYSAFVYMIVVSVAVGSQFVFFKRLIENAPSLSTLEAVSGLAALIVAVFIEGFGLAFYATSVSSRLQGRSGWVPRLAAWAVTGFAAWLQFQAHRDLLILDKPLVSYACAAASVGAMLLAEVRTTYKVGETLEQMDQKDRPQARLGVKFWLRYTQQAWWAWSAQIANPAIRTRTDALQAGRELVQVRKESDFNQMLMAESHRALRAAEKKAGTSEAILFRLNELAHLGVEALAAQAQLLSAERVRIEAEKAERAAAEEAERAEAEAEKARLAEASRAAAQNWLEAQGIRPEADKAAVSGPASMGEAEASGPAQDDEAVAQDPWPSFEDWSAEVWAERPNGPQAWAKRVAELASVFPKSEAGLPSRSVMIQTMKLRALDPELPDLRYAWTNKGYVGQASKDLAAVRERGYPDPQLTEAADPA